MNIKRAKQEITDSIEAYLAKDEMGEYKIPAIRQRPILLMGPPGIGKTQIMEQVAKECKVGLVSYTITHHTRQSAVGLPFIEKKEYGGRMYSVAEYTMSEIIASVYEKMEQTGVKEGILFIDEINCVSETLAPTMLQFLQCKTFGNQKVPEGWTIVAAGNPPEYNKSVRDFDIVTLDRVKRIDVEENYEVWRSYAYEVGMHPAILSYLEIKKDYFYVMENTVDGLAFATARGWEDLSQLICTYEDLGKQVDREVVAQYIQHAKIAKDFANYLELYRKYEKDYALTDILEGRFSKATLDRLSYASFDERLSVVGMLISKLNESFKSYVYKDRYITTLYQYLKPYMTSGDLKAVVELAKETYADLRKKEQLTREENQIYQKVLTTLDGYLKTAMLDHMLSKDAVEMVREGFSKEADALERIAIETGERLDHAFMFMEQAFSESQEMVSFVTELNTNFYSVQYLKENDNAYYFKHNKSLLLNSAAADIKKELEEIKTDGGTLFTFPM